MLPLIEINTKEIIQLADDIMNTGKSKIVVQTFVMILVN